MLTTQENEALIAALESHEVFKLRGFAASCGPTGSVLIERWGHMRGVWHYFNNRYVWTAGASSQPLVSKPSVASAVEYTLTTIVGA